MKSYEEITSKEHYSIKPFNGSKMALYEDSMMELANWSEVLTGSLVDRRLAQRGAHRLLEHLVHVHAM